MLHLTSPTNKRSLLRVGAIALVVGVLAAVGATGSGNATAAPVPASTSAVSAAAAAPPAVAPVAEAPAPPRAITYKAGAAPATAARAARQRDRAAARAAAATESCVSGPSATVCVFFTGFDALNLGAGFAQARTAYLAAAQEWANLLVSSVTITIDADVEALGDGVLAATGPEADFELTAGGPWYPVALANTLAGHDLDASSHDISSSMGSAAQVRWYYGTDGNTPVGEYDFESVAMHEIAHGLGIFSLTGVNASTPYGNPKACPVLNTGCFGYGGYHDLPGVYDTYLQAPLPPADATYGWLTKGPQGQAGAFGNGTAALFDALTSGGVRWAGAQGVAAAGNTSPHIYSPSPWNPGSSISHLDSGFYRWPGPNSLLTPYVPAGSAVHLPGPIVLGMLRDIGWTETVASRITGAAAIGPTPNPAVGAAYVTWQPATRGIDGTSPVTGYRVQAGRFDQSGAAVTLQLPASATSTTVPGLTPGVAYWVSVTPLSAAPGPGSAAGVTPQDLGSYTNLLQLVPALMPNFLGSTDATAEWNVITQLSYPNTTTTVQGLVALNAFLLDPVLGPLTRLYSAYFGRLPDPGGTTYWLGMLRGGTSLSQVSGVFATSREFRSTYGALSDAQFLDLVYQNVLGRAPDASGYAYWMHQLAAGMSRGHLMVLFSESAEYRSETAGTVAVVEAHWGMAQAIPTTAQVAAQQGLTITQLFQGLLDHTLS